MTRPEASLGPPPLFCLVFYWYGLKCWHARMTSPGFASPRRCMAGAISGTRCSRRWRKALSAPGRARSSWASQLVRPGRGADAYLRVLTQIANLTLIRAWGNA